MQLFSKSRKKGGGRSRSAREASGLRWYKVRRTKLSFFGGTTEKKWKKEKEMSSSDYDYIVAEEDHRPADQKPKPRLMWEDPEERSFIRARLDKLAEQEREPEPQPEPKAPHHLQVVGH